MRDDPRCGKEGWISRTAHVVPKGADASCRRHPGGCLEIAVAQGLARFAPSPSSSISPHLGITPKDLMHTLPDLPR
nr:hypothetical protein CFP56_12342 [Quercus suber]